MAHRAYTEQVALLVRILPYVAGENVFALKGGTAINLFYRNLPRLSVDIDLTYLPLKDRQDSLGEIDEALDRIASAIERGIRGSQVQRIAGGGRLATRILARLDQAEIKIETSPVLRGAVHEPEMRSVTEAVEDEFGFAENQVVSFEDLYAGKIHAALDRQHPRDLFDIKLLYENEGFTEAIFQTFLVYVASSPRPAHELLSPNLADLDQPYTREFEGMTRSEVSLAELIDTRMRLVADIRSHFSGNSRNFLLGLHDGQPDFRLIGLPHAENLPAVRWKLMNLEKLKGENPQKHASQRIELERVLNATD